MSFWKFVGRCIVAGVLIGIGVAMAEQTIFSRDCSSCGHLVLKDEKYCSTCGNLA
jgi:hypothetical protein